VLLSLAPPGGVLLQVKVEDVDVVDVDVVDVDALAVVADEAVGQDDFARAKGGGRWGDLITPGVR
jgi:hypothetical protein